MATGIEVLEGIEKKYKWIFLGKFLFLFTFQCTKYYVADRSFVINAYLRCDMRLYLDIVLPNLPQMTGAKTQPLQDLSLIT